MTIQKIEQILFIAEILQEVKKSFFWLTQFNGKTILKYRKKHILFAVKMMMFWIDMNRISNWKIMHQNKEKI